MNEKYISRIRDCLVLLVLGINLYACFNDGIRTGRREVIRKIESLEESLETISKDKSISSEDARNYILHKEYLGDIVLRLNKDEDFKELNERMITRYQIRGTPYRKPMEKSR